MSWRDTVFVWRGNFKYDSTAGSVKWKGTWVGVENAPNSVEAECPTSDEFTASEMQFDVFSTSSAEASKNKDGECNYGDSITELKNITFTKGKGWYLDDEYHSDDIADAIFTSFPVKGGTLVVATGSNEYGSFLSVGQTHFEDMKHGGIRQQGVLTLARRYLTDQDIRNSWSLSTIVRAIVAEISKTQSEESRLTAAKAPWQMKWMNASLTKAERKEAELYHTNKKRKYVDISK